MGFFKSLMSLSRFEYSSTTFFGIEVGAGKDVQSGNFSIVTGIPTATKANADNPKRCCICGKWMLFCPKVVEEYSNLDKDISDLKKPIKCLEECNIYKREEILNGKCFYAMHKAGKPENFVMQMPSSSVYHFHLNCLMNDPDGAHDVTESKIVMYYPYVGGLEEFEKLHADETVIQSKIDELKNQLSKLNSFEE